MFHSTENALLNFWLCHLTYLKSHINGHSVCQISSICRRDIHHLSMTLPVLEGTSVYKKNYFDAFRWGRQASPLPSIEEAFPCTESTG
jgi:hypothetical protein